MLAGFTWLLIFQLAGEIVTQAAGLPLPGPVLGMAFLFVALVLRNRVPEPLSQASRTVLSHLPLLFVPAGVGVMVHGARLVDEWLAISLAVVGSTLVAVGVTGWVLARLMRAGEGS